MIASLGLTQGPRPLLSVVSTSSPGVCSSKKREKAREALLLVGVEPGQGEEVMQSAEAWPALSLMGAALVLGPAPCSSESLYSGVSLSSMELELLPGSVPCWNTPESLPPVVEPEPENGPWWSRAMGGAPELDPRLAASWR